MNTNKQKQAGLTLIELVIALVIFSIIATTAYSGLTQILRAQKALDDQRDIQMIANSVVSRLSRELQMTTTSARLLPPANSPNKVYPSNVQLLGESNATGDSITFVADDAGQYVPDGRTHSGTVQISYRMAKIPEKEKMTDEKVFYLIRDEIPIINPVDRAYKKRMTFPITNRLAKLSFRYFNIDQKKWLNEWPANAGTLPGLVQFNLQLLSPAGKLHTFTSTIALKRK
jgi:type II secretion system protein J